MDGRKKMNRIYLDNASTTFPKPKEVPEAMYRYMTETGSNIGRGCYSSAYSVEEQVYETRQLLCDFFHGPDGRNVVFTKNITESLNIVLKGFLHKGDHVIISSMEHNAVMRPLVQLEREGVSFTRIPCREDGTLPLEKLGDTFLENTKAVVMTHASNVCGTLLPIEEVGNLCREHQVKFIVDCAQTAGVWPVDMEKMNIDVLCFTGHKGLLGPQGIGGFILKNEMIGEIEPLLSGGTGSFSHTELVPELMPDRFEAGTMNLPGILGLGAALKWHKNMGPDKIREHELALTKIFLDGLKSVDAQEKYIRAVGRKDITCRTGVVSVQTLHKEMAQAAFELDDTYGIMTRVGLHCAPSAHKTLGTFPAGTIRFSFGWWNTTEETERAVDALWKIAREK